MSCGCKNKLNRYVDAAQLDPLPWDDAVTIVAIDKCGKVIIVDKPLYELTDEDRDKLDQLIIDGDGTMALFNDGQYKAVFTVDEANGRFVINGSQAAVDIVSVALMKLSSVKGVELKGGYPGNETTMLIDGSGAYISGERILTESDINQDAVVYNDDNDIETRRHIILPTGGQVKYTSSDGITGNLISSLGTYSDNIVTIGTDSNIGNVRLNSRNRPEVNTSGVIERVAYVSDTDAIMDRVDDIDFDLQSYKSSNDTRVTNLEGRVSISEGNISDLQDGLSDLSGEYNTFKDTVNQSFITVNNELTNLDGRITQNTTNIAQNRSDIDGLINDLSNLEKFRGYFETTTEITSLPDPTNGDYAWNAETGTVWIYNGTTWADSGTTIPDQTIDASDATPLMDGTASAGSSNQYSRGDHRHPSDITKADAVLLDNYLPLSGNTQTTQMTGPIWTGTAHHLYLSDSGNSYLGFDGDETGLQLIGNGAGGVDIRSSLGTIKANGQRIIVNGVNTPSVQIQSDVIQFNQSGSTQAAYSMVGGIITESAEQYVLILGTGGSGSYTANLSSGDVQFLLTSGKMFYGPSAVAGNEVARISDIQNIDYSNFVTLDGSQTITGEKTLSNASVNGVNLTSSGDGSQYLANDGTYKVIETGTNVFSYETTITNNNIVSLSVTPEEILFISFERVILYESEFTLNGNTLTLVSPDLDFSGTNRIKIIYK